MALADPLWEEILFVSLVVILILSVLTLVALVLVFFRRYRRWRYFRRLDLHRSKLNPTLKALTTEADSQKNLVPYTRRPLTVSWEAVEMLLIDMMETHPGEMERISKVFDLLGYGDFYLRQLTSRSRFRRALAAYRLGKIRCFRAAPSLRKALEDKSLDVRIAAMQSLSLLGATEEIRAFLDRLPEFVGDHYIPHRHLEATLIAAGKDVVPALLPHLLQSGNPARYLVCDVMGSIADRGIVPQLLPLLSDPDPEIRARAAKALGTIGDPSAYDGLVPRLKDSEWFVRLQAARALGRLGLPKAVANLQSLVSDRNWQVRSAAVEAIRQIGAPGVHVLVEILERSQDRFGREQILEEFQRAGLIDQMIETLLSPDRGTRRTAERVLRLCCQNGFTSVVVHAAVFHRDKTVRERLERILRESGKPEFDERMRSFLEAADPSEKRRILESLTKLLELSDEIAEYVSRWGRG